MSEEEHIAINNLVRHILKRDPCVDEERNKRLPWIV
jgi:hypothetical protein